MFRGGRPGIADAAPLAGYSPLVISDAVLLVSLADLLGETILNAHLDHAWH